jgi:hypothetical protein
VLGIDNDMASACRTAQRRRTITSALPSEQHAGELDGLGRRVHAWRTFTVPPRRSKTPPAIGDMANMECSKYTLQRNVTIGCYLTYMESGPTLVS